MLLHEAVQVVVLRVRRVGQLRTHQVVDVIRRSRLVLLLQDEKDVGMWQTALLELDYVSVCCRPAEHRLLHEVLKKRS